MRADNAILKIRRDLTIGSLLRTLLLLALLAGLFMGPAARPIIVLSVLAVWAVLSVSSAKGSRLAAGSSSLIAAGHYDEAEKQIEQSLQSFSLFRSSKLLGLHRLALLRHAQRRWEESAALSKTLLTQRLGSLEGLGKSSRLMLAEALLETGELNGAGAVFADLHQQRLALSEALKLLQLQIDHLARLGAWSDLAPPADVPPQHPAWRTLASRIQMAELLPGAESARTQACLALALKKVGREDEADWLRRRVELLADVEKLTRERPALWELWRTA